MNDDFSISDLLVDLPIINYEYSIFMTDDGEVATGVELDKDVIKASLTLCDIFKLCFQNYLEENPNRVISFVIQTSASSPKRERLKSS